MAITDELRARFLPPASLAPAASLLLQLPAELLSVILSNLDTRALARLAVTCRLLYRDAPTPPPPPRQIGPVETELRRRAEARGLDVGSSLPEGATSWVACLLKRERRDAQRRQTPLAVGHTYSIFVDTGGRLHTCGHEFASTAVLGHAVDPDADPNDLREIVSFTPVPSMQDRRIFSVAASSVHCLALSAAEGEVYSWGDGFHGSLGHGDVDARAVPSRIESLSRIEFIAVGQIRTSAAVDEKGRLFTWGQASLLEEEEDSDGEEGPSGLGYELDVETEYQAIPKRVDALSQDRVMGVALGFGFTLAVTGAGAVFSFGSGQAGKLGHGSLESVVLPRRIEPLTQTGRRFVTVAAGSSHAFALTEEGELYGWGDEINGHGREERTPHRVAALIGQRIKCVHAESSLSGVLTEEGELFTWGLLCYGMGHGIRSLKLAPTRVEGFGSARIAVLTMCWTHTLAVDEDGVVWAFGARPTLGLGASALDAAAAVLSPTPIPTLRVHVL